MHSKYIDETEMERANEQTTNIGIYISRYFHFYSFCGLVSLTIAIEISMSLCEIYVFCVLCVSRARLFKNQIWNIGSAKENEEP